MAFADFTYSSGLRRRDVGTLLVWELPPLESGMGHQYYSGWLGKAVAKPAGRFYYVSHGGLQQAVVAQMSKRRRQVVAGPKKSLSSAEQEVITTDTRAVAAQARHTVLHALRHSWSTAQRAESRPGTPWCRSMPASTPSSIARAN